MSIASSAGHLLSSRNSSTVVTRPVNERGWREDDKSNRSNEFGTFRRRAPVAEPVSQEILEQSDTALPRRKLHRHCVRIVARHPCVFTVSGQLAYRLPGIAGR